MQLKIRFQSLSPKLLRVVTGCLLGLVIVLALLQASSHANTPVAAAPNPLTGLLQGCGMPWDVDEDGVVDVEDIMAVAARWRTSEANPDPDDNPDTPNYEAKYDLDGDKDIDIVDIMLVVAHWGESCYDLLHNASPSSSPWTAFAGQSVNVVFGNYVQQSVDLFVSGRGLDVRFVRTHNSASLTDGPLGYGWTHSFNMALTQESSTTVLVRNADGRLDRFTLDGSSYQPPPGVFNVLTDNGDDTFSLKHKDQTVYNFDTTGRLASIVDKNDNTITLGYSGDNLTTITDTVGRAITLTYNPNNHLTNIADSTGRTITYTYDFSGDLTSATDPGGATTTYEYDT